MTTTSSTTLCTLVIALAFLISGCESSASPSDDGPNVVEVTARGLSFDAPDEIPSGWTSFRLNNESEMLHFALIARYPEGKGIEEHQEIVAPVFQEGMDLLNEGKVDSAMAAFGQLPEWFGETVFLGGPGLIAPGETAQTSVYLEPGTYVLECYVKTDGVFHSYNPSPDAYGMVHEITATEDSFGAPAPEVDIEMTISSEDGIVIEGSGVEPGEQTVAVHFADQTTYEHFLGHDVHLVRLEEDTDIEALATWMDWTQPTGLETPAPAEFLGGTHDMPAGETGYFTMRLEPGQRYAWIAEVPDPAGKDMLKTFTVASE